MAVLPPMTDDPNEYGYEPWEYPVRDPFAATEAFQAQFQGPDLGPAIPDVYQSLVAPVRPPEGDIMQGLVPLGRLALSPEEVAGAGSYLLSQNPVYQLLNPEAAEAELLSPVKPDTAAKILAGTQGSIVRGGEALTSIPALATMGAGGAIPGAGRAVSAVWAGEMLRHVAPAAEQLGLAVESGDPEKIAAAATDLAQLGTGVVGGAKHAILPGGIFPEPIPAAKRLSMPESLAALDEVQRVPMPPIEQQIRERERYAVPVSETASVLRDVQEQPGERPGPLPAQEGVERVPPSGVSPAPGDEGGPPPAEETRGGEVPLKPEVPKVESLMSEVPEDAPRDAISDKQDRSGFDDLQKLIHEYGSTNIGVLYDYLHNTVIPDALYRDRNLSRKLNKALSGEHHLGVGESVFNERAHFTGLLNSFLYHEKAGDASTLFPNSKPLIEELLRKNPEIRETLDYTSKGFDERRKENLIQAYLDRGFNEDYMDLAGLHERDVLNTGDPKVVLDDWFHYRPLIYEKDPALGHMTDWLLGYQEQSKPYPHKPLVSEAEPAPKVGEVAKAPGVQARGIERPPSAPPSAAPPGAIGIVPHPGAFSVAREALDFIGDVSHEARVLGKRLSGASVPRTSMASEESGNKLVQFASAKMAAPLVAKSMATDVLGDKHYKDYDFANRLGAVLVEDRLLAIKDAFLQAGDTQAADKVTSIIGKKGSPLQTQADFEAALNDPEIQAAIDRHKQTVQSLARQAHVEARGKLAGLGKRTGAFVNLKAIFEGQPMEYFLGGGKGNLSNPLRRPSAFSQRAKGTADMYEIDYRSIAERMVKGNFENKAKRDLYAQLVKDGLAVITDPGDPIPNIGGRPAVGETSGKGFTIERRGVPSGDRKARTYIKNLWVRSDLAPELRQALDVDGKIQSAALIKVINLINGIQLKAATDAVWHTVNMISTIAGSQGGGHALIDIARKFPGINVADAVVRVAVKAKKMLQDAESYGGEHPDIQRELAGMAKRGELRQEHKSESGPSFLGVQLPQLTDTRRFIEVVDRAGRLVRNDMYNDLVKRGWVTDTPQNRRRWVNQLGQYNPRLMGQFQRIMKEAGLAPFIVAGRNFNQMALRRLTLYEGVKATNRRTVAQMAGINAVGWLATLAAVPSLLNYLINGDPSGRPGTKFGQIDLGTDTKEGKHRVIDPSQWVGLRRGLRITGAQALAEGLRSGERAKTISQKALRDIFGGIIHPWAGPAVTAASVGVTGWTPSMYKESENPNDYVENLWAAAKQANPALKAFLEGTERRKYVEGATDIERMNVKGIEDLSIAAAEARARAPQGKKAEAIETGATEGLKAFGVGLGGAVGFKEVRNLSPVDQLRVAHSNWLATNKDPRVRADYERFQAATLPVSKYRELDRALATGNRPAIRRALNEVRKTTKNEDILQRMEPYVGPEESLTITDKPFFHESVELEQKFKRSLTPEQRELYRKAIRERKDQFRLFLRMWARRGPVPKEGEED